MKTTVGFIGFGNMAQAMAKGLLLKEVLPPQNICACAKHWDKLEATAHSLKIRACRDARETALHSDIVVLAVKPYLIEEVINPILDVLREKIVVSVAAGLTCASYDKLLLPGTAHLSTIPNTPVSVGEGIIICESDHTLSDAQYKRVKEIFSPIGLMQEVETKHLSIAGTVAGCGPAFASMFLEALSDGAVQEGLPRALSYRLASQMLIGTGKLQLQTGEHPGSMKDAVCSPGGTTIVGVAALERGGLRSAVIDAIHAVEHK